MSAADRERSSDGLLSAVQPREPTDDYPSDVPRSCS